MSVVYLYASKTKKMKNYTFKDDELDYLRDLVLADTMSGNNIKKGGKLLRKLDSIKLDSIGADKDSLDCDTWLDIVGKIERPNKND